MELSVLADTRLELPICGEAPYLQDGILLERDRVHVCLAGLSGRSYYAKLLFEAATVVLETPPRNSSLK